MPPRTRPTNEGARFVALLRGINVGGNNVIKMTDLRACFEGAGFIDVSTYIQSGNVLFSAKPARQQALEARIEAALDARFGYESLVVVVSAGNLAEIVAQAPAGFGTQPDRYRHDVLFLKQPLDPAKALAEVPHKPGVDEAHAGSHALYYRRLISKATQSRLSKIVQLPLYKSVTVRNWNTTTKLLGLTSDTSSSPSPRRRVG